MDAVSQLTVELYDPQLKLFLNNYFMIRRSVYYKGDTFEIASVEVDQGEGAGASIRIECRREAIQKMKRDKQPAAYAGITSRDYAETVARAFGLGFVGENTTKRKSITKATGSDKDESVWDVLRRLANEAQFSLFESDSTLYFASQEWLMGKWANLLFTYPSPSDSPYQLVTIPNCRRSDDNVNEAEIRFMLQRTETIKNLRPGMTVFLAGMGEFVGAYLITEVTYDDDSPEPIGIACRTPVKKKTDKNA